MHKSFGYRLYSCVSCMLLVLGWLNVLFSMLTVFVSASFVLIFGFDPEAAWSLVLFSLLFCLLLRQNCTGHEKFIESTWLNTLAIISGVIFACSYCEMAYRIFKDGADQHSSLFASLAFMMFIANVVSTIFHLMLFLPKYRIQMLQFEFRSKKPRRFA